MPEIANGLVGIAIILVAIVFGLVGIYSALSESVKEQRRTNDISERMAKIIIGGSR
jgi:hypothetical protein